MISSTPCRNDRPTHGLTVKPAVGLDARALDRAALAAVEHPAMDGGAIGGARHQAVEHVEFADQMSLADAADRRIAAHLADILGAEGDQPDARAATRRGRGRFAPA